MMTESDNIPLDPWIPPVVFEDSFYFFSDGWAHTTIVYNNGNWEIKKLETIGYYERSAGYDGMLILIGNGNKSEALIFTTVDVQDWSINNYPFLLLVELVMHHKSFFHNLLILNNCKYLFSKECIVLF